MRVDGSVALVTGGASGLGLATVRRLYGAGAAVVIAALPSSGGAAAAEALGPRAVFAPTDVTSEGDVTAALDAAEALGELRIAVNCAGVATPGRVLGKEGPLPLDRFRTVVEVNLLGTFNVLRLAAERMAALDGTDSEPGAESGAGAERGVIVMTASAAAFEGQIGQAAYAASKAGVHGLTLCAARDLSRSGIRVCTVAPGLFETPMLAGLPQQTRDSLAEQIPHPSRLGRPDEYAALVQHIVENPMLNGETIRLDGAMRMGPR